MIQHDHVTYNMLLESYTRIYLLRFYVLENYFFVEAEFCF